MSVEILSGIQFAVVALFYFLLVPLTVGLAPLVAYMETRYLVSGDETFLKMARFWGNLFIINFPVGVVTGIALEFQFGMNWADIRSSWEASSARPMPSRQSLPSTSSRR